MQYIQFQKQDSIDIPSGTTGNANLYIDIQDSSFKVKDENGIIIGNKLVTISKANMDTMISVSGLSIGQYYKVTGVMNYIFATDVLYGGTDIILQAVDVDRLSTKGYGIFYNPNYDLYNLWTNCSILNVSNKSGQFGVSANIIADNGAIGNWVGLPGYNLGYFIQTCGNWLTASTITDETTSTTANVSLNYQPSYNIGDKVIWGGNVWVNLTGSVGAKNQNGYPESEFKLDDTNWSAVTYNTTDYITVVDEIEYDYGNDCINYRRELTENGANEVRSDFGISVDWWGYSSIKAFPWGRPNVYNCSFKNVFLLSLVNFIGTEMFNIEAGNGGEFDAYSWGHSSSIHDITMKDNGVITEINFGYNVQVYDIRLDNNCGMYNITLADNDENNQYFNSITMHSSIESEGPSTYIQSLIVREGVEFTGIDMGMESYLTSLDLQYQSQILDIVVGEKAYITQVLLGNHGRFRNITLGMSAYISNVTIVNNADMFNIKLDGGSLYNEAYTSYMNAIQLDGGSYLHNINIGLNSFINNIDMRQSNCRFRFIDLGIKSYIGDIIYNGYDSRVEYLKLAAGSNIDGISLSNYSNINNCNLSPNSSLGAMILYDSATLSNIELATNSGFGMMNILAGVNIDSIQLGAGYSFGGVEFKNSISTACIMSQNNTMPWSIDINGASAIDMSSFSAAGIITLTSRIVAITYLGLTGGSFGIGDAITDQTTGAQGIVIDDNGSIMHVFLLNKSLAYTPDGLIGNGGGVTATVDTYIPPLTAITITSIVNGSGLNSYTFVPEAGLSVTFSGTSVTTITNNQIALPTGSFIANGSNGDYIKLQITNSGYYKQIEAVNYL